MIKSVPIKLIGTILCISGLWTTGVIASITYDHKSAHTDLKALDQQLKVLDAIKTASKSPKTAPKIPLYKKELSFMASWILGDHYGENGINQNLDIELKNDLMEHLDRVVKVLSEHIKISKSLVLDDSKANDIIALEETLSVMKNGIMFDKIFELLAQEKISKDEKLRALEKLTEVIHNIIVHNGKEILIPAMWKGSTHGGVLAVLNRDNFKVFDTRYDYNKNTISPGETIPMNIRSCSPYPFKSEKFNIKELILTLINMRDVKVMEAYETKSLSFLQWRFKEILSRFFKWKGEPGKTYFDKVLLTQFEPGYQGSNICRMAPLTRLSIGTVGDLINVLRNAPLLNNKGFKLLKLEIGAKLLKDYLNRFSSDSDIQYETRNRSTITELIKRCMNRVVSDAYILAKDLKLIKDDIGASENDFWYHLNTLESVEKDLPSFKELKRRLDEFILYEVETRYIIPEIKDEFAKYKTFTAHEDEILKGRIDSYRNTKIEGRDEFDQLKAKCEEIDQQLKANCDNNFEEKYKLVLAKKGCREEKMEALKKLNNSLNQKQKAFLNIRSLFLKKELKQYLDEFISKNAETEDIIPEIKEEFAKDKTFTAHEDEILKGRIDSYRNTKIEGRDEFDQLKAKCEEIDQQLKANCDNFEEKDKLLSAKKECGKEKMKALKKLNNSLNQKKKAFLNIRSIFLKKKENPNRYEIELFAKVLEIRKETLSWIKTKGTDLSKLRKMSRSLDQRETPLIRKTFFNLKESLDLPFDLTDFMPRDQSTPDYTNCMAASDKTITTIEEFIRAFDFIKTVWKWTSFKYEMKSAHCKSFARRNIEVLLQTLDLGGMDEESLKRWTPKTPNQYSTFKNSVQVVSNSITGLSTSERTLEDYIILLRLQRIVWRVTQALDLSFSQKEPQRHLDLIKYSLSYPQCHQLIKEQMNYSNYFLADSGFYSNILNPSSMSQLKNLCKELIDEENSSRPVLNYQKYFKQTFAGMSFYHISDFEKLNDGDREIYYKMAQNAKISSIVRRSHSSYSLGRTSVADNAARACSLGKAGAQFIYYHFYDAVKIIFTATNGIKTPIYSMSFIPVTFIPLDHRAILFLLEKSSAQATDIQGVNKEILNGSSKSYTRILISEMLASHILGLDVIVNHLGRASAKLWSSGSISKQKNYSQQITGIEWIDSIVNNLYSMFSTLFDKLSVFTGNTDNDSGAIKKTKTFRNTIAGNADFFINCSSHMVRKLDVSPDYEILVMSLLMKTIDSVENDLEETLEKLESEHNRSNTEEEIVGEEERNLVEDGDEVKKSSEYLKNGAISPNEYLKSLINWSVIALRFTARIRGHKHAWRNRFSSAPTIIYSIMAKFSRLAAATDTKMAPLKETILSHVEYVLYMTIAMNPNDLNLRQKVFEVLSNLSKGHIKISAIDDLLPAAMIFHRFLALSRYEKDVDGPITEDFISNQFGMAQVTRVISSLAEKNESFLTLMAMQMSQFLDMSPTEILNRFSHGDNLKNGVLIYDSYAANIIQGSLKINGLTPPDPNEILKYRFFKRFFSAGGGDEISINLGKPAKGCLNRFEVKNYMLPGADYSICLEKEKKKITIYRHIPKFKKPCKLILQKKLINVIQEAFSVFTNEGVDVYHCVRGNNVHFVWIGRNAPKPSYISYGRTSALNGIFTFIYSNLMKSELYASMIRLRNKYFETYFDFETKMNLDSQKEDGSSLGLILRMVSPVISFPKLEIVDSFEGSLFPITSESKISIVPEPLMRFSGGSPFGTYTGKSKLVYMFQQFRFKEKPENSLTFIENESTGALEMHGRVDWKVCEDQVFEYNFWPALMVEKKAKQEEREGEISRYALVPITNPDRTSASIGNEQISVEFDENNSSKFSLSKNPNIIFIETMAVKELYDTGMKTASNESIKSYVLKPTSRIQRILLAYNHLKLRNYDESLKLLDPKSEIDHNTQLSEDEKTIFMWMIKMSTAVEPEALAIRLIANIHMLIDQEIFIKQSKVSKSVSGLAEDPVRASINDDEDLIRLYQKCDAKKYMEQNNPEYFKNRLDVVHIMDTLVTDLGTYFNYLNYLPKRFRVEQVFRDVMPSTRIQAFLESLYGAFNCVPVPMTLKPTFFMYEQEVCDYSKYIGQDGKNYVRLPILEPLNELEDKILDDYIKNRFMIRYTDQICDLPRLILQKLIQLNAEKMPIPVDLRELIQLYFSFSRHKFTNLDKYVYSLAQNNYHIDLKSLKDDLIEKHDPEGKLIQSTVNVSIFASWAIRDDYGPDHQLFGRKNQFYEANLNLENTFKTFIKTIIDQFDVLAQFMPETKTAFSKLFDPLKYFESEINDVKDEDENSIKFAPKDFHYVRFDDRKIIDALIKKINAARAGKSKRESDSLNSVSEDNDINISSVLKEEEKSRTQAALQTAINDYMNDRSEPVEFDKFDAVPFAELSSHIEERLMDLEKEMKKLRNRYSIFYESLRSNNIFSTRAVLSNLNRMFNSRGKPELEDLRDCLIRMSYMCIQSRLPEMPKSSILKIVQILKEFYIQKIIHLQFTAIKTKINSFNTDVATVKKLEAKCRAEDVTNEQSNELKKEIFGYKDKAVSTVEDIYNDLEKLLLLEVRLQDPVTLNFEFMSNKYHLTKIQVQDVSNLATRHWETELRTFLLYILRYRINTGKGLKSIKGNLLIDGQKLGKYSAKLYNEFVRIVKIFNESETKSDDNDKTELEKYYEAVRREDKTEFEKYYEAVRIAAENMWAYLPHYEINILDMELFDKSAVSMLELKRRYLWSKYDKFEKEYYGKRPAMAEIAKNAGKLKPYNTEADSYLSRVIQRKMAAGKTTVLGTAATVKKADGKTLSILVILASLYQSSAPNMQKRTSEFFKSTGFSFSMPDPRLTIPAPNDQNHPAKNFLTWTLKYLIRTINTNSYLIVTPKTLQSFLNSYVEFLDAFVSPNNRLNPELSHCLHLFATIYDIFRTRGSVILDEIDSIMRPQKELNFPTTSREKILMEGVEITADLLLFSAFDKDIIDAGLNLMANQQASLRAKFKNVKSIWRKYVKGKIEDKTSPWNFLLPNSENEICNDIDAQKLVNFMFNDQEHENIDTYINFMKLLLECDRSKFHAIMIVKMQMKSWMKECFDGSVNEHYGPSLSQDDPKTSIYYAIPYMAANTPAEGSIFADRWETVNKTFMMYLVKKLTKSEISRILFSLSDIASKPSSLATEITQNFSATCSNHKLFNIQFNHQNQLIDKDGSIFSCMTSRTESSLRLIFIYVIKAVFGEEDFYSEQITSNAINLTTMFPSVQGYSGTIDNVNVLPHQVMAEAEKDHRLNEKANGAIAWKLLKQPKDCVTTVDRIEQYKNIKSLLAAIVIDQIGVLADYSALVDVGALLKDFTNKEVAIALADIFDRNIVLYYDESTNRLSFYKKSDASFIALEGSETKDIDLATGSKVVDRFTYYDQSHITGSDILQPPTAKAFLTIGPKVLLRDILQGVMRMRQFQSGQSIHFVTTSAVEELLSNSCKNFPEESQSDQGARIPRAETKHLLALGALNEDKKQMSENVRLYKVKIDAELRAYVLDVITDALAQEDPYMKRKSAASNRGETIIFGFSHEKLFKSARSLFIRNVSENPLNWATIDSEKNTLEAVQKYLTSRIELIPEEWKLPGNEKWSKVCENLKILTEPCNVEDSNCQENNPRTLLAYLDKTLEVPEIPQQLTKYTNSEATVQGSTVEMEMQLELQVELQVELNQEIPDYKSREHKDEPILSISTAESIEFSYDSVSISSRLAKTENLLSPWKMFGKFYYTNAPRAFILSALKHDIFCPGYDESAAVFKYNYGSGRRQENIKKSCLRTGHVGISSGLVTVSSAGFGDEFDFATKYAREATHLLFWRGTARVGSHNERIYAVYLLSGSEAISLHKSWSYKSSVVAMNEAFWLTDLYGYEIHSSPFSVDTFSSNKFSLLEREYKDHFADLHFRALVLNGSYNVIISSNAMYHRMRKWIGDSIKLNQNEFPVNLETSIERIKLFMDRLIWTSKLRNEIVPQDPFIRFMLKLISKNQVEYRELDNYFKDEHAFHTSTRESSSDPNSWEEELKVDNTEEWKNSENINKTEKSNSWKVYTVASILTALISLAYYITTRKGKEADEGIGSDAVNDVVTGDNVADNEVGSDDAEEDEAKDADSIISNDNY